jgi:hypothetical protein
LASTTRSWRTSTALPPLASVLGQRLGLRVGGVEDHVAIAQRRQAGDAKSPALSTAVPSGSTTSTWCAAPHHLVALGDVEFGQRSAPSRSVTMPTSQRS